MAPQLDPDAHTDVRGHGGPGDPKQKAQRTPDGKKVPPQTFLQKYGMWLLPGAVLLMNMVAPPPPPAKGKRS